jgi:hypothetical protein
MGRKVTMLSALISLLTGCSKPAEKPGPPPEKPGVSLELNYPVVLAGERRLIVEDNQERLITTTVSSGVSFPEYRFIDSGGMEYRVKKVTEFGRKNAFFDMGTSPFQVFLEMQPKGIISLKKAKALLLEVALKPDGAIGPHGKEIATERIQGAMSVAGAD